MPSTTLLCAAQVHRMTRDALRTYLHSGGKETANFANCHKCGQNWQARSWIATDCWVRSSRTTRTCSSKPPKCIGVVAVIELITTGQYDKARQSIATALHSFDKLCKDHPLSPDYHRWLIEAHLGRGELLFMIGKIHDSERDLSLVIKLCNDVWSADARDRSGDLKRLSVSTSHKSPCLSDEQSKRICLSGRQRCAVLMCSRQDGAAFEFIYMLISVATFPYCARRPGDRPG